MPDTTLADPQQIIADLRRELDGCRAEHDEALEQQTAIAEVLQVINSSPGDLAPVFDAMLHKATRLCGADFGILWTFDSELAKAGALHQVPEEYAELVRHPFRPSPGSGPARMMKGEHTFAIADLTEYPPYRAGDGLTRALVDLGGAHSVVIAPLRRNDVTTGAITLYSREVRPFTDKQIALLQNFAAQAVIAMENGRLITETREALEQQTATAEVLQVINSSPGDVAPVFDTIVEKAMRLCEAAHGHLLIYDGARVHPVAVRGDPRLVEWMNQRGVSPVLAASGPGAIGRILGGERYAHITDVLADEAYRSLPHFREMVDHGGIRTLLDVPLRKDGSVLGIIAVYRQEIRPFSDKEIALLENFAAQAVIAMENARLINETREALDQQTATSEVLRVINSSPGDLSPVFDAILEKAHGLCGIDLGELELNEDGKFRAVAMRGVSGPFAELLHQPFAPPPGSPPARLMAGEPIVQFADLFDLARQRADDQRAQAGAQYGLRTVLFVPLRKDGSLLGYITAYRKEVRSFSDKEIALLQNFAAQAVIAMENTRLITETREALEQQTATAEVLQVINSSPGDLAPVFDAMLEKAMRLCEAEVGNFWTYDGKAFTAVAMRDARPEHFEWARQRRRGGPGSISDSLIRGESVIHIPDAADTHAYRAGEPARRAIVDLNGGRTLLAVALRKGDELLGYINIFRRVVRPFSDKQIALLQNFAAQAVIAMENARLLTETREALEQQTATAEVLQVINSSPGDLTPVFEAILEKAHAVCGAALGGLLIYEGEEFRPIAIRAEPSFAEYWRQTPVQPPRGGDAPYTQLIRGERIVHLPDVRVSNAYRCVQVFRDFMDRGRIRTLLVVPLRKDNALLGAITAFRQEVRPFTDQQIALLQNFAQQAVIAIENGRLLDELRQRTNEVAELNRGLEARVAEQVEELGRVGRLKRFLAPQLAELIVSQGDEKILESHRREIVVVFCDLRGYTAFTETAEPEEVLNFLREYHGALGPLVSQFEGTLDQFSGDGIMVFFNDPVPCPDPAERAVKMAMAMREAAGKLIAAWRRHGCDLGFGTGIAQGYATLGQIGFSERSGYTAIGTVCNLAARLCAEAKDGQILISSRIAEAVEAVAIMEDLGNLELRGLRRPVAAFNVVQSASEADARPNLTVVGGGPGGRS
jgi:GAF domain-containing protein